MSNSSRRGQFGFGRPRTTILKQCFWFSFIMLMIYITTRIILFLYFQLVWFYYNVIYPSLFKPVWFYHNVIYPSLFKPVWFYHNYIYPGFYLFIWFYHNYIYPGFYKVLAPTEVKILLCLAITATVSDLIRRIFFATSRRRTVSESTEPTELLNGAVHPSKVTSFLDSNRRRTESQSSDTTDFPNGDVQQGHVTRSNGYKSRF